MGRSEGYKGFQKKFSPRTAARIHHLYTSPNLLHTILAPLFGMGYFHATRRRQATSVLVTTAIIGLVLLVRQTPQPWRGIVDLGVVAGLMWGLVSIAVRKNRQRFEFAAQLLTVHLLQHEGTEDEAEENEVGHLERHMRWKPAFAKRALGHAMSARFVVQQGELLKLTDVGRSTAKEVLART